MSTVTVLLEVLCRMSICPGKCLGCIKPSRFRGLSLQSGECKGSRIRSQGELRSRAKPAKIDNFDVLRTPKKKNARVVALLNALARLSR
jgi:hypothetical protein